LRQWECGKVFEIVLGLVKENEGNRQWNDQCENLWDIKVSEKKGKRCEHSISSERRVTWRLSYWEVVV
jgi:hypothetical protein